MLGKTICRYISQNNNRFSNIKYKNNIFDKFKKYPIEISIGTLVGSIISMNYIYYDRKERERECEEVQKKVNRILYGS